MRHPRTGLAPEGFICIFTLLASTLVAAILDWDIPAALLLALTIFSVHFFRDPERVTPHGDGLAVSPADGKIIRISDREDPISGDSRVCISIFMNVFSVHVNRVPVAGEITNHVYTPGKFFNAAWDKASRDNERCAWQLRDDDGKSWTFVQIAGLIARRIAPRAEVGDKMARGERFGMIRFGSRVDLYLPEGYKPAVSIGENVFAGQSVIARQD